MLVSHHPDAYGLWPIIVALEQRSTAVIANAFGLWWLLRYVEDRFALLAGPAPAKPADNLIQRQFVVHYCIKRDLFVREQFLQALGLSDRSGKSVEHEAAVTAYAGASLAHQLPNGVV